LIQIDKNLDQNSTDEWLSYGNEI